MPNTRIKNLICSPFQIFNRGRWKMQVWLLFEKRCSWLHQLRQVQVDSAGFAVSSAMSWLTCGLEIQSVPHFGMSYG